MKINLDKEITRRSFLKTTAGVCIQIGLPSILLCSCQRESTLSGTATPLSTKTTAPVEKTGQKGSDFEPAYLKLHRSGELENRAEKLWEIMERCQLCPRKCGVNRLKGESGFCHSPGSTLVISSFHPHFGEERPLVGTGGSGTIFISHCNLRCVFCQNWEISQLGMGTECALEDFAAMMLRLQDFGCHNINFVTPTHYSAHILKALAIAADNGLRLPVVYNTSGWERLEILEVLDGIVDIYLPDFKYWDNDLSAKYSSGAESYPEVTKLAILEMHRQVGVAIPINDGIMQRGLMIRHLVMPNNVSGSERIIEWIADSLPKDTFVNIMAQYTPLFKAYDYPEISRRLTREEYVRVVERAQEVGLTNLEIQGYWWLEE